MSKKKKVYGNLIYLMKKEYLPFIQDMTSKYDIYF